MTDALLTPTADHQTPDLVLRFSHNIIEHLGLKLYQNRPTNGVAELVSDAWDAGSGNVWIDPSTVTPVPRALEAIFVE
jgi:hypothetical protein